MKFIQVKQEGDYRIVTLARGKANVINHDLVRELSDSFYSLEQDTHTKGVILMGQPGFFSAGLDVIELFDCNKEEIKEFFVDFIGVYLQLMKFSKPFICGVTGHSPAGGTVLAITADYRVMADHGKYSIGLNEVAVGVQISQVLINGYAFWLGQGLASRLILQGALLDPQKAYQVGLVDEICPVEKVLDVCKHKMDHLLSANQDIFVNTKKKIRSHLIASFEAIDKEAELQQSQDVWWDSEVRQRMAMMVDFLTAKKEAKKV